MRLTSIPDVEHLLRAEWQAVPERFAAEKHKENVSVRNELIGRKVRS
jgi:hypothetical protein